VWLNGMEVTQFTYFQQVGGVDCNPITVRSRTASNGCDVPAGTSRSVYDLAVRRAA
jgi:glycyl-tRNA synthetase alpha chain